MGEVYDRNVGQNSEITIQNESKGQNNKYDSSILLPNREESTNDDRLSREKYLELFNKKRNKGKSNTNKSNEELENSSFNLPKYLIYATQVE